MGGRDGVGVGSLTFCPSPWRFIGAECCPAAEDMVIVLREAVGFVADGLEEAQGGVAARQA